MDKTQKTRRATYVPDRRTALKELAGAAAAARTAQQRLDDAVAVVRSPDADGYCIASWAEVAAALGITRQAAQQRYNRRGL